jgi:hypothetical protein
MDTYRSFPFDGSPHTPQLTKGASLLPGELLRGCERLLIYESTRGMRRMPFLLAI